MKLNDYVLNAMELIDARFQNKRGLKVRDGRYQTMIGTYYDYTVDRNRQVRVAGLSTDDFMMLIEARDLTSACTSQCLVFDDLVVKWEHGNGYEEHSGTSDNATDAYNRAHARGYGMHVAETVAFGRFTVQERVPIIANKLFDDLCSSEKLEIMKIVADFAIDCNLGDVHSGNYGFRWDDCNFQVPVIFDFSSYVDYSNYTCMYYVLDKLNMGHWNLNSSDRKELTIYIAEKLNIDIDIDNMDNIIHNMDN
jgi:hypothetical protein